MLDVHPHNFAKLADPGIRLWITEGVKKGDALTSAGECVVTLSGVFNWRNQHGALGDWEDVPLRGREVLICFDSDAATNRNVARAMKRLGAWLRSRGARQVRYIVTPPVENLGAKTGVDDHLGRGGTVQQLLDVASAVAPDPDAGDDSLTDSRLSERLVDEVLIGAYRFCRGLGWLHYDGSCWRDCPEERVLEEGRRYLKGMLREADSAGAPASRLSAIARLQSASRIAAVVRLTKGMDGVLTSVEEFDQDGDLLNVANGVINLRSGELFPHDPDLLMRRRTDVVYAPDATHSDWQTALEALPDQATADWAQIYLGTATTGFTPREDFATFWQGGGSNGKSTVLGAVRAALGEYATALLPTVLGGRGDEHPTQMMDLLGARLAFVEETGDGHKLDTVKLKQMLGTGEIRARRMRQDPVSFRPSHTLVITTNYRPVVRDTDHGTWRRLRMISFPKSFGRDGTSVDRGLRSRLEDGAPQAQAVLAWLVAGAQAWFEADMQLPPEPEAVTLATQAWRQSTDLIYTFVNDELARHPGHFLETEQLRRLFNDWLPEPHRPWGKQTFAERFEEHEAMRLLGATRGKHPYSRRSGFFGVTLRTSDG